MKTAHKKLTSEDKFARKHYCNSYRFIKDIKRYNNKKFRRILKRWGKYGDNIG